MDRREFLISTGGTAAVAALSGTAAKAAGGGGEILAAPAIATKRQTLSFSMPWADTGRGYGDSARRLALRVHEATDGRITFALAASRDEAQVTHGPAYTARPGGADELRALAYFSGLPGSAGLAIHDHIAWLTVGGGQMLWDDLARDRGVKPLAAGHSGAQGLIWSKEPVEALAALEGRKIAAMGAGADVARGLGLEPVALDQAEASDFVEAGGAFQAMALDIHRSHGYALDGGLSQRGTLMALEIKLDAWEGLHPGDRARIALAAEAELSASLAEARAHEAMVRGMLSSAFGIKIAPMPAEIAAARDRVAEAVVAHIAAAGERAQRIDQSYMAFKGLIGADAVV